MSDPASPPAADPTPSLGSLGNPDPSAAPAAAAIPAAPPQFFLPTDYTDEKGNYRQGWTDNLPDDLKGYAGTLGKYPNVKETYRALGEANKALSSRQSVKLPGDGATDEQWGQYRAEIAKITGAPENAEGYGIKAPEGKELAPIAGEFAQLAHKYGAAPEFVHKAVDLYNKAMGDLVSQSETAQKAEGEALITKINSEWGKAAAENWQQTKRGIAILGGDPTKDTYSTEDVIRMGLAADKMFREDAGLINGDKGNTMATIDEKMAQLRAEPAFQNPKNDKEIARQLEIQQQLIALHEAKKKQF